MTEKILQLKTRSLKLNKIFVEVIVAVLLIVWLHTSISKLLDFGGLTIQMIQSPVFRTFPMVAAIGGPALEIVIASLLIFRKTRLVGLIASFFLLLFFSWYVWRLMTTMPQLPCVCGGVVSWLNWPQHLALNISLSILSLIGIVLLKKRNKETIK